MLVMIYVYREAHIVHIGSLFLDAGFPLLRLFRSDALFSFDLKWDLRLIDRSLPTLLSALMKTRCILCYIMGAVNRYA